MFVDGQAHNKNYCFEVTSTSGLGRFFAQYRIQWLAVFKKINFQLYEILCIF
jgi:hypothetical protein